MTAEDIKNELGKYASDYDAVALQRFFKTGPGEYGEGDVFIGVKMGPVRTVAKKYTEIDLTEVKNLISSPIHEHRMCALVILVNKFKRADQRLKTEIYELYLQSIADGFINNWDLVDVTCGHIVGAYLVHKPKDELFKLAKSNNLWERRVAMISTSTFINLGQTTDALKIAKMLMNDSHDLIHKAVGWMLREMGKRVSEDELLMFLDQYAHEMPRVMLRYAIEKLPPATRQKYMSQKG